MRGCAKRRFKKKLDAQIAAASMRRADKDGTRVYYCHRCGGFHLTSQIKGIWL